MINVADLCVHHFSNFPMVVSIIQKDNRNFLKNPHCACEFSVCSFWSKSKKTIHLVYLVSNHSFQVTLASYQQINKPTTLIVSTSMMWSPLDQFSDGDRPLDGGVVCLIQPLWPLTPPLSPSLAPKSPVPRSCGQRVDQHIHPHTQQKRRNIRSARKLRRPPRRQTESCMMYNCNLAAQQLLKLPCFIRGNAASPPVPQ